MIRKVYRKLYAIFVGRLNPQKYIKKIGVNFTYGTVFIYGKVSWGT